MALASLEPAGPLVAARALIRASGLMLAWGLMLACGPSAVAGVIALLNGALSCPGICASGAVADGVVEGCGLPEDEGDGDGPGDVGPLDWPLPPPDGALGACPEGACELVAGLGELLGVWDGLLVCARGDGEAGADGAVDGVTSPWLGTRYSPFEVGAAGDADGRTGPFGQFAGELRIAAVFCALAGGWLTPVCGGLGVVVVLDGAGADGATVVGLCDGAGPVGVCDGAVAGACDGVTTGTLDLGSSGGGQVMLGDGLAELVGLIPVVPEPLLCPPTGCPLPEVVPPPGVPDPDDGPDGEPMLLIAWRRPGTAAAVPPNRSTAATAMAGRSHTVPSR
jgi:hypothetical protein